MFSETDEKKGVVKVYWNNIRERVAKIEPTFAELVDKLNPDKNYPIYLAYYPYGMTIADPQDIFLPNIDKGFYKLNSPNTPKDIMKHLGYGKDSLPIGMVIDKDIEFFIDLKNNDTSIPWSIYTPGTFFPFARVLSRKSKRIYAPNNILTMVSGGRSTFMLPNIGCATNHSILQRDFNVQSPPPKSLYEHWGIFKELTNSEFVNCQWRSCLMYLSEKWLEKLHNDKSWLQLKLYLHEWGWQHSEYRRNHIYYDITFSVIQQKRNLKPNPYLTDTARHLFTTALGAAPGYAPACDEQALPLDVIQKIYFESYGMKKYLPTIMQPKLFSFENEKFPIYYSLQIPSTHVFSPKSRKVSSTLFEMRELAHIIKIFTDELSKNNALCSDTIIGKIAREAKFNYFHNENDRHKIIIPSSEIQNFDTRFNLVNPKYKTNEARFSSDAPFVRGCVSISR